jgi:hypothetical protein
VVFPVCVCVCVLEHACVREHACFRAHGKENHPLLLYVPITNNNPTQQETDGARAHALVRDGENESKYTVCIRTYKHMFRYWEHTHIQTHVQILGPITN